MSLLGDDLDAILSYGDSEIGTEVIIQELDVQNLNIGGQQEEGPGTVVDLDSQVTFSVLGSTSSMSPDSGFEEDVRTPVSSAPTLLILEQPEATYRFRYLKESNKPHGPLKSEKCVGLTQKQSNGPRVKLVNFHGKAIIRMWLWGSPEDGPSPHRMVTTAPDGGLSDEPHDIEVYPSNDFKGSFDKFNIVHVVTGETLYQKSYLKKVNNIAEEGDEYVPKDDIAEVEETFDAKSLKAWKSKEKDICALYFEAFGKIGDKYVKLCSALSEPIKNTKSARTTDLKIKKQSLTEGSCEGGMEMMLFTDKLVKDISVIFECDDGRYSDWRAKIGEKEIEFHKLVALAFKMPPFATSDINEPVMARFYIQREKDQAISDCREFRYLPKTREDFSYLGSGHCRTCGQSIDAKRKRPQTHLPPSTDVTLTQNAIDLDEEDLWGLRKELNYPTNAELEDVFDVDELAEEVPTDELVDSKFIPDISAYLDLEMDTPVAQGPCLDGAKGPKNPDLSKMRPCEKARLLHCSIVAGQHAQFQKLAGIDTVNVKLGNKSPLHLAVLKERNVMVGRLVALGADPYALDGDSNTAVHVAIERSPLCLQTMLSSAIKPRTVFNKDGDDPVLFAIRKGNLNALRLLLNNRFRPFARNVKDGDSPLHVAIRCTDQSTRREMIDVLLKHDCLVSIENGNGISPLDLAESEGDTSVIEKLKPFCVPDSDDEPNIDDDDLAEKLGSLKLTPSSSAASSTDSNPDCVSNKMYLALDGDVATSTKVAELMGFKFLMPLLATAQKQSQIFLTYLERTKSRQEAETILNKHVLAALNNGGSSAH